MREVRELLLFHLRKYPGMQPVDCLKLVYQSEMGPGHLLADEEAFRRGLEEELETPGLLTAQPAVPEEIGPRFSRVYLSGFDKGPSAETFTRLCALAAAQGGDMEALQGRLRAMRQLAYESELPFQAAHTGDMINRFILDGCPQPHHSERYRRLYRPHYRVLLRAHAWYLPVFAAIDRALAQKPHVLVGIDGMSAAGKSNLASVLEQVYRAGVVHTDDFFLQGHQRTATRLAGAGGNIDYERLAPVAAQAADDRAFAYQRYDCQSGAMAGFVPVPAGRVTLLEGVYALHPKVGAQCDVRVFLAANGDIQARRLQGRSPALAARFAAEWIPMENRYFSEFGIRESADVVVDTTGLDAAQERRAAV